MTWKLFIHYESLALLYACPQLALKTSVYINPVYINLHSVSWPVTALQYYMSNFLRVSLVNPSPPRVFPEFSTLLGSPVYPLLTSCWLLSSLVNQSEGALGK